MTATTKFGRMVTYNEEFPSIESQDPLIKWSCNGKRKIKCIIFPLPQFGRVVT